MFLRRPYCRYMLFSRPDDDEDYLCMLPSTPALQLLGRYRCWSHDLEVEKARHKIPCVAQENGLRSCFSMEKVLLGASDVAGWGAFLRDTVNKDEYLGEYTGELITHYEADKRGNIYDSINSSFLFNLNDQIRTSPPTPWPHPPISLCFVRTATRASQFTVCGMKENQSKYRCQCIAPGVLWYDG
eukprot:TRINITY_DN12436_c0_g1_i4.p1 TRINITY_DN12436_c0_g1~~TRINITY_DN12436_c0_g1_i4.p1  ORF type:complete len:185 (-),score=15.43 TRINITY_DN12436_c0_g1_i4:724-1278(-)